MWSPICDSIDINKTPKEMATKKNLKQCFKYDEEYHLLSYKKIDKENVQIVIEGNFGIYTISINRYKFSRNRFECTGRLDMALSEEEAIIKLLEDNFIALEGKKWLSYLGFLPLIIFIFLKLSSVISVSWMYLAPAIMISLLLYLMIELILI